MTQLTVEAIKSDEGYNLVRSDGQRFLLIWQTNGHAALYAGANPHEPPMIGIVDFDVSVSDKLEAARRWVLAYPEHPT